MHNKRLFYLYILCLLTGLETAFAQFYYGMQMEFGKNRIQYQTFNWTYLDFDRFKVYQYQGGQEVAKYVAVSVSKQLPVLEKRLDFQVEDKLQILVYNNQNDFKQSNLGLAGDEQNNIGGVTRIVGDKISVFFNGSHADLDKQIREALAELMIDQMMYGGRTRDVVRNSTLLVLPDWFKQGLVAFLAEGWDTYTDIKLMDAIKQNKFYRFNRLAGKEATLTGQALWYFIADTYGEAVIPHILYMTKVTRNPDNAFLFVIGNSLNNLILELSDSFNKRYYNFNDTNRKMPVAQPILLKPNPERHYYNLKISPDEKKVVYASYELNQFKVWINTIGEKKQKRILKYGPKLERMDDYNYPLLGWHPNNKVIAMVYEQKDQLILHTLNLETNEKVKRNITGFEKINSFSFSADGKKLALSAVKKGKGQSDIFIFTLNSGGLEQITNDIWDDNHPVFIKNNTGLVFESNRNSDTIKWSDDAKYFYKLNKNNDLFYLKYPFKSNTLVRITNSPEVNDIQAQEYDNGKICYLSERNGIYNKYVAKFDSAISFIDTTEHYRYFFNALPLSNYNRNVMEHSLNSGKTKSADIIYSNGVNQMWVYDMPTTSDSIELKNTWFKNSFRPSLFDPDKMMYNIKRKEEKNSKSNPDSLNKKSNAIDFSNYTLSGEKEKPNENKSTSGENKEIKKDSAEKKWINPINEFKFPIQQNYYTAFYTDYIVTQLDNSYLNTTYQRYTGGDNPIYLNPGLNALIKIGLSDLFEDRRIVAGFRVSGSLDNEYLLSWENRKKRIDHQWVLHRQSFLKVNGFFGDVTKIHTHDARYSIKYPFSEVSAAKFSLLYRNDRTVFASVGDISLPKTNLYDNYSGARAEYVFDNTRKRGLNLYNGIRFKFWGEYWRLIKNARHDLITFGFDARSYTKVHRDLIWCNRLAGGASMGTDRLIFYLGGVDNWFNASFDRTINVVKPDQYQFQTLATNMRGFKQNIRNGNNFVVFNSELRFPIFKYFINQPIRSDFINNFQIITYSDLGMAWYGKNPLSEENVLNKNNYYSNPITLTIYNRKNPLVGGVGFGVRSRLIGYFVRLDFGWGIDDLKIQKRVNYISFTTDF